MKNVTRYVCRLVMVLSAVLWLTACSKSGTDGGTAEKPEAREAEEEKLTAAERQYLAGAKQFARAIAGRNYDEAFAQLSGYATARMSLNQFAPEDDEAKFAEHEKSFVKDVTLEKFRELMSRAEARHGTPRKLLDLSVFSTDPAILNRRGKESLDALDSMFAIGNMPESVPAEIRRASLRGQIRVQLPAQELEKIAKAEGTTVADLEKNPDFEPYFTIKVVLVEDAGQLKVGYFEFLPPSLMD